MRGTGPTSRAAAARYRETGQVYATSGDTNGALMRILPAGWAIPATHTGRRREAVTRLTRVTHGAPAALTAACAVAAMGSHAREQIMATVSVRYIVNDIDVAISFYTRHLGFSVHMHPNDMFAVLTRDDLRLVLSVPGSAGGGQPMPDGTVPEPGGWNRFPVEVPDLAAAITHLRRDGVRFRNDLVTGVGGKQIIAEDPSGNPVELFEPTMPQARLSRT